MNQLMTLFTYTLSPFPETPLSHMTISVAVMTPPIQDQHNEIKGSVPPVKESRIQLIEIEDPVFLEKYDAYVTKKASKWCGWIPEFHELEHIRYEEKTKKALLETLTEKLHETLEARAQAWDKQIEEDIKAGKLDHLREKALEDIHAGRYTEI